MSLARGYVDIEVSDWYNLLIKTLHQDSIRILHTEGLFMENLIFVALAGLIYMGIRLVFKLASF